VLKHKGPARTLGLPCFLTYYFKYTKWSETQMYFCEKNYRVWFEGGGEFSTVLGA